MSIYPNYTAGQRLTAADLQAGQFMIAVKTSNTDRASITTLTADPDLSFALAANAVYLVEFYLHYAALASASAGFNTTWAVPSGASGNRSAHGLASTVSDTSSAPAGGGAGSVRSGVHGYATAIAYGSRNSGSNQCFALEEGLVTTSSAGTCAIQWAQNVSNATATRLAAGSWARALRIS